MGLSRKCKGWHLGVIHPPFERLRLREREKQFHNNINLDKALPIIILNVVKIKLHKKSLSFMILSVCDFLISNLEPSNSV